MKYQLSGTMIIFFATMFSGSAQSAPVIDTAQKVLSGNCLVSYRTTYKKLGRRKAFAAATDENGRQTCAWEQTNTFSGGAHFDALLACRGAAQRNKIEAECVLVDMDGNLVVEEGALPEFPDAGYDLPEGQEYIDLHDKAMAVLEGRACQRNFRRYMLLGGFKTFAYTVSDRGAYSICTYDSRPEAGLAEKLALERCNKREQDSVFSKATPECKVFAQNNDILLSREDYGMKPFEPDSLVSARRLHLDTLKSYMTGSEDINQVDKRGRSTLFYSVETNRLDVVQYLTGKGADVNLASNKGDTPLKIANERKYTAIAKYLQQNGGLETVPENESIPGLSELISNIELVTPTMALDTELTPDHVDRFLKTMPTTAEALKSLQKKVGADKEANKKLAGAMPKGEMFRTVAAVATALNEITDLKTETEKAGFESIGDWAYVGDRITSVFMVSNMLGAIASIPYADQGFTEGTNVFEFIDDESKSEKIRNELRKELESSCTETCVVPKDLAVVGARIKDVEAAFNGL